MQKCFSVFKQVSGLESDYGISEELSDVLNNSDSQFKLVVQNDTASEQITDKVYENAKKFKIEVLKFILNSSIELIKNVKFIAFINSMEAFIQDKYSNNILCDLATLNYDHCVYQLLFKSDTDFFRTNYVDGFGYKAEDEPSKRKPYSNFKIAYSMMVREI